MNAGPATSLTDPPVTASRRRILARTRLDFWLDALLLVAYTLAYSRRRGPPLGRLASWAVTVRFLRHLTAVVLVA